jgi:two-component system KDP operon response regulator KdpE
MARLLVVDDDPQLLRALSIILRAAHHDVQTAVDGAGALACAAQQHPDLVILDLGLPDIEGTAVISRLREWTTVPIIVLSGRASGDDKTVALDLGADDYVTKPFSAIELQARIRASLRRGAITTSANPSAVNLSRHRIGDWMIDLAAHTVTRSPATGDTPSHTDNDVTAIPTCGGPATLSAFGAPEPAATETAPDDPGAGAGPTSDDRMHLTPTEWRMLAVLLRRPGRLVESRDLLNEVWGKGHDTATNYLRIYMSQLRAKLEPVPSHPRHLLTDPGFGYHYQPDPTSAGSPPPEQQRRGRVDDHP